MLIVVMPGLASNPKTVSAGFCAVDDAELTRPVGRVYLQRSTVNSGPEPQATAVPTDERSAMFAHAAGFRPLWPLILFLPWLLVGMAWLLRGLVPGRKQIPLQVLRSAALSPRRSVSDRDRLVRPHAARS